MTAIERVAVAIASIALSILLIALLSGYFTSRDSGALTGAGAYVGQAFRDLGDALLKPGQAPPRYDSVPPTSGPHLSAQITRDEAPIDDNQLLSALASGDVVIFYGTRAPPPGLASLAAALAPPFSPALASAGDSVILSPRAGTTGLVALAWAHMLKVGGAADALLHRFAGFWLGRGAPHR